MKEERVVNMNMAIIEEALKYPDYTAFIKDPALGLTPIEQMSYIKACEERKMQEPKGEMFMDNRMTPQKVDPPKQKIFTNPNRPKRNGYVNAVLLTSITLLFGILCLTFMVTSITSI